MNLSLVLCLLDTSVMPNNIATDGETNSMGWWTLVLLVVRVVSILGCLGVNSEDMTTSRVYIFIMLISNYVIMFIACDHIQRRVRVCDGVRAYSTYGSNTCPWFVIRHVVGLMCVATAKVRRLSCASYKFFERARGESNTSGQRVRYSFRNQGIFANHTRLCAKAEFPPFHV